MWIVSGKNKQTNKTMTVDFSRDPNYTRGHWVKVMWLLTTPKHFWIILISTYYKMNSNNNNDNNNK